MALGYVVVASLWIGGSDLAVALRAGSPVGYWLVNAAKGMAFVWTTGALLFLVLRHLLRQEFAARTRAEELARQEDEQRLQMVERDHELEQERQKLRLQHSALQAAANAIVITDREGKIEWVNEAFTRLTGYGAEEALGNFMDLVRSGLHDDSFYRQMWKTVLAGKAWQGTLTNKRKDGTVYHEEMTITPVRNPAGEISHFIAIKQDITERRRLEQQFLRAQRMQSIGLLAGGIAHDLNNVLAPVLMAIPLLRKDLTPAQRAQVIDTLESSVRRGATIVQQVLTFARGVEVQRTLVQARHLIREVARIAEETFPRTISIHTQVPSDLWLLEADPTQIHQVLLNLVVNARDAMPEGGRLEISASNLELMEPLAVLDFELLPGRYIFLSVSDNGTGIAPEVLDRIFEPFFTTKAVGKGTGLGLSTVMGIVKSHDGLVEVKSDRNAGSTFSVYLPAAPKSAAGKPDAPAAPPAQGHGHGQDVLVVDDEPAILHLIQTTLESRNYRAIIARDGVEGLARLAEHGNTLRAVITDLMMPRMGGLEFIKSLRQDNPGLPVIAITGLMQMPGEPDRTAELRAAGVTGFLSKPFQSEDLLSLLDKALEVNPVDRFMEGKTLAMAAAGRRQDEQDQQD